MLQITGYRLPFLCPLCSISPENPRFPLQPCCLYPAEIRRESQVQLPVNSLMSFGPTSSFQPYSVAFKPLNAAPLPSHDFQSTPIENITRVQAVRNMSSTNSNHPNNGGRDDLRQIRCTAAAGDKKKRRKRTIFTCEQLSRLESEFEEQQYMVGTERQQLAEALNLSETQIKIWFQNRRIKWRKENKQNYPDFLASPFSIACARVRHSSGVECWNNE